MGCRLAYEVMKGNTPDRTTPDRTTPDRTTLPGFRKKIEETYGSARRVWVMDRGVPTEAILKDVRRPERRTFLFGGHAQKQDRPA
jgi:hypothetical protein